MDRTTRVLFGFVTASLIFGPTGASQSVTRKAPTAGEWASLAKLPDFNGVWESAPGGGGGHAERWQLLTHRDTPARSSEWYTSSGNL